MPVHWSRDLQGVINIQKNTQIKRKTYNTFLLSLSWVHNTIKEDSIVVNIV